MSCFIAGIFINLESMITAHFFLFFLAYISLLLLATTVLILPPRSIGHVRSQDLLRFKGGEIDSPLMEVAVKSDGQGKKTRRVKFGAVCAGCQSPFLMESIR